MTDGLNPSKLREIASGSADGAATLGSTTGIAPEHEAAMSFFERSLAARGQRVDATELGKELVESFESRQASRAVHEGNPDLLAYLVGMTDSELSADAVTVLSKMTEAIENNGAPMQLVVGGLPETGKTNTALLVARIWKMLHPDGVLITNMESLLFRDLLVRTADGLLDELVTLEDRRALVLIDEASRCFGAKKYGYQVEEQWVSLAKKFAKFGGAPGGVDSVLIGHTLLDISPECLRLATLVLWKEEKELGQFYASVDPEDRALTNPMFPDPLSPVEKMPDRYYDPDDMAPWTWDLNAERVDNLGFGD